MPYPNASKKASEIVSAAGATGQGANQVLTMIPNSEVGIRRLILDGKKGSGNLPL
jgi:hypothetical protein